MGVAVLKSRWLLLCLGFLLLNCMSLVSCQSTQADEGLLKEKTEESDEAKRKALLDDLESLSVEELEAICTERGLEVVRDDSFTHADFVEAARQCLAFEEQLLEVLDQYPDLEEEVTADLERLQKEKEALERERDEKLAEKERLQKKIQEFLGQDSVSSDSAKAAFGISKSSQQGKPPPVMEKTDEMLDNADTLPVDIPSAPNNLDMREDTQNNENYDSIPLSEQESEDAADFQDLDDSSNPAGGSKVDTLDPDNLLTIHGVAKETLKQIQSDLRKLQAILAPVVQTLSPVVQKLKEFAWKYCQVLFSTFLAQEQEQEEQVTGGIQYV